MSAKETESARVLKPGEFKIMDETDSVILFLGWVTSLTDRFIAQGIIISRSRREIESVLVASEEDMDEFEDMF